MQKDILAKFKSKSLFIKVIVASLISGLFIAALPFLPVAESPSLWVIFGGRFHPLVIHFPIVLLFILLVKEILVNANWIARHHTFQWLLLLATVLTSIVSALIGFALYSSGDYGGNTLRLHLWAGVGVALLSLAAFLIFWYQILIQEKSSGRAFFSVLLITNLLVIFASHQGGALTHGEDFLTEHFPLKTSTGNQAPAKPQEDLLVYQDILRPVLDSRCFSCHNQNKSKGEYQMTEFASLVIGGKSGKTAIHPHIPDKSELIHRIMLPADHDDHMPPDGKTPLNDKDIRLLRWWIQQGASDTVRLVHFQKDSLHYPLLAEYARKLQQQRVAQQKKAEELEGLIRLVDKQEQNFSLVKDPSSETLALSMAFPPKRFDDNQLAELQAVFPHIRKASFAASEISDDGLYYIGQMKNLQSLYLQKTLIRGSGLVHLQQLSKLEILDLSSTKLDDANLLNVLKLENLKELYLHDNAVHPIIVDAMRRHNPDLQIHLVRGPLF